MSATEELRRLLDERGVEHEVRVENITGIEHIIWHPDEFSQWDWNEEFGAGWLNGWQHDVTTEQAIAATLGADARPTQVESSGTLTAEKVRELIEENSRQHPSPTDPYVWLTEYDWQAIADELNTTLRRGTCHDVWDTELTGRLRFQCSECGAVSLEIAPRFCPACGRKVETDG